jgi:AcrR family transcriptional regulator
LKPRRVAAAPQRRTRDSEATEDRVRRSALKLFAKKGFNGTGIRDIAEGAGLTTATLYYYMTNKDDLLMEIMLGTIAPLNEAAKRAARDIADPAARLAMIVEQHVWAHATDRLRTLVSDTEVRALSGAHRAKVLALRDDYEAAWRAAVRHGVDEDVFETGHVDVAARALLQMATGVSHWFSARGELSLDSLCRDYSDWALAMLRAHRGRVSVRRADLELPAPTHFLSNVKAP